MILFSDWLIGEILASYWSIGKGDTPNKPHIYNNTWYSFKMTASNVSSKEWL